LANQIVQDRLFKSDFDKLNDIDHENDSKFDQFVIGNFNEVCPAGGLITYEGGKIKCSVHSGGSESEQGPGEEVPWI
jgi:hypothetical protein